MNDNWRFYPLRKECSSDCIVFVRENFNIEVKNEFEFSIARYLEAYKGKVIEDSIGNIYECLDVESHVRGHEFSPQHIFSHSIICKPVYVCGGEFEVGVYLQIKNN